MARTGASRRSMVLTLTVNLAGIAWSVGAVFALWIAGVVLWQYATSCSVVSPLTLLAVCGGVVVAATCAGAVPASLTRFGGSPWMAGFAIACSAVAFWLYAMVIAAALMFGLSGGSSRWYELITGAIVTLAPSFALAGANVLAAATISAPRKAMRRLTAWAVILSAAAAIASIGNVAAC
ncbi:hypothetical protein J2X55_002755 [Microbacterium sp. 1154]|uniref:hypothetical protein n=1 Tax=Microbacterium sp. 1154 TaxID=2817733 RepID=UPI000E382130|nr:hypothetical protein [Microbacterium sp. 1154]MDR6691825.1 hypothetical protein [Microbacterium sp. 1154]